jgi:hypothetical protein
MAKADASGVVSAARATAAVEYFMAGGRICALDVLCHKMQADSRAGLLYLGGWDEMKVTQRK